MLFGTRKTLQRTARDMLAVMTGLWLLLAAAPCVMAAPMPMMANHAGNCPDHKVPPSDCDALATLDCQAPKPVPPSATFDVPAFAPMPLYTLPAIPVLLLTPAATGFVRPGASPPPPHVLNRKHSRLLI